MSMPKICPYCGGHVSARRTECPSCHASVQWAMEDTLPDGTVLAGRYKIVQTISQDGEGYLYGANDQNTGLLLNIKEYFPFTLSASRLPDGRIEPKSGFEVPFKTARMDFEDLYTTLQQVTPATGLIAVLDVVRVNGSVYAVMEKPRGQTLSRYLRGKKPLRPAEVRSILQPVMEGVASMHKAGLIHRGISPETILITRDGAASLAGYATQELRSRGSELKPQMYEGYMAPEQYSMAAFEGRYTDVYSLAAVAYRLATGHVPISAQQRLTKDSLERAEEFSPAIPSYFSDVLGSAMALAPEKRIQNVPELMGMLASQTAAHAMMATDTRRETQNHAVSSRKILMLILASILLLLCLAAMLFIKKIPDIQNGAPQVASEETSSNQEEQESDEPVLVPDFVGKRLTAVQNNSNYKIFRFIITEEYSADAASGVIIRQTPSAGSSAEASNNIVELVISRGPQLVTMPKIFGFTQEKAVEELDKQGIRYSLLMLANDGQYAAGTVARTDPEANVQFDATTMVVNVYIAAERDNSAAPTTEDYEVQNQSEESVLEQPEYTE